MIRPQPSRCPHLPHALDRRLDELECAVSAAVVPGEVATWAEGVLERLDASARSWQASRDTWVAMTEEILDADPALGPRMVSLRDRLREMDREVMAFRRSLERLCAADEKQPVSLHGAEELRHALLEWSVACRSIGGELDTWFTEAYYRDRGVGD